MFYDMISLSIWKQLENFVPLQIQYQIFGIAWLEIDSQFEKHFQVKKKSQISSELILK